MKAYTDFPFMDLDILQPVTPLREVELVKYVQDAETIIIGFSGDEQEIDIKNLYREPRRPEKGYRPKRVFKTILTRLANKKPLESVIGVDLD